jgi:hypothetical protein
MCESVYKTFCNLEVEPVHETFCKLVMECRIPYMVRTHKLLGSLLLNIPVNLKPLSNIFFMQKSDLAGKAGCASPIMVDSADAE